MLFGKESRGGAEWIIAFLGNPGPRYEGTRHNAGFAAGAEMARRLGVRVDRLRFRSLTARADIGGHPVLLMLPQTFMNLSGEAISQAARFYKVEPGHVIVVSDEMALPPGTIRVRPSGSAGGHNGLKSVIACLGTEAFPRIRLGVGEPPRADYDAADWVLGRFQGRDAELMASAAERAAEAAESYVLNGPDRTMSKYNVKAQ